MGRKNKHTKTASDSNDKTSDRYTLMEKVLIPGIAALFVVIGIVVTHFDNQNTYELVKKEMQYSTLKDYIIFLAENQNTAISVVAVEVASQLEAGEITLSEALNKLRLTTEAEQTREMKMYITSLFNTDYSIQQDAITPLRVMLAAHNIDKFIDLSKAEIQLQKQKQLDEDTYNKGIELIIYIMQVQPVDIYSESGQIEAAKELLNMDEVVEAQGTYYRHGNLLKALEN